ncbi:MAG: DUF1254 domain-containing protein [Candidatus Competibacteraceae bacterium]|nr:DUF1254 domain-containing protein [Candidatus Competibacteraceae bacterium]
MQITHAQDATPEEARNIAKEAYIYGYPLVENYRIQYAYFADKGGPQYKGPWNTIINIPRVYTPKDTAIQTPNSDTPYSFVGADLRAQPIVLTVPKIEKNRYYSLQFMDAYTFNFHYVGSRTTGNDGGKYLLAGPAWKGEKPEGIDEVIRCETEFAFIGYRTQLFNPEEIDNVIKIQDGYKAQLLSDYLGQEAPESKPALTKASGKVPIAPLEITAPEAIKPLTQKGERTSLEFFQILNLVLSIAPTPPEEQELRARFTKIGVGGNLEFEPEKLSSEMKQAIQQGMADAWTEFDEFKKTKIDTGEVTAGDMLGSRKLIDGRWIYRMGGTVMGIYGNSKQEAMYPLLTVDAEGKPFDGANKYTLTFEGGKFPPVNAFWSLTMYNLPESLLVANPINRYLINSPMLPNLKKNADGGVTLYIQNESPGEDKESNWLPAPKGKFWMPIRMYWPKKEALDGEWKAPAVQRVN